MPELPFGVPTTRDPVKRGASWRPVKYGTNDDGIEPVWNIFMSASNFSKCYNFANISYYHETKYLVLICTANLCTPEKQKAMKE